MFYKDVFDQALRFGDVVKGFVSSIPKMTEPNIEYRHPEYALELSMPQFCAVMSPCCSIGDSTITLAPLLIVKPNFYKNPYFSRDLTNINRVVSPKDSIPPEDWNSLSPDEKDMREKEGYSYTFLDYFIYAEHDYLPKYKLKVNKVETEIGYYMIDFRRIFRVNCGKIRSPEESPIETRILQLHVDTRQELRDKISRYYSRVPKEDSVYLSLQ